MVLGAFTARRVERTDEVDACPEVGSSTLRVGEWSDTVGDCGTFGTERGGDIITAVRFGGRVGTT